MILSQSDILKRGIFWHYKLLGNQSEVVLSDINSKEDLFQVANVHALVSYNLPDSNSRTC